MTASATQFRTAVPADRQAIAEMWLSSWASTRLAKTPVESQPTVESLRERLDAEMAGKWTVTVAEKAGRIQGFLALDQSAAVLDQLFVAPDCQGQGIGGALLSRAKEIMPDGFSLRTAAENEATGFYDRAGLQRVRMMVHPATGHRLMQYRWSGSAAFAA